jgi:galactokinase
VIDVAVLTFDFRTLHGTSPRLFYAPGRVNLIGEHTDYCGGFVLPMAIDRGTAVAAARRDDRRVRARSRDLGVDVEVDLDGPISARSGGFLDYVEGVVRILDRSGARLPGADVVVAGDVPLGSGLSSSASLDVALGLAMTHIAGSAIDRLDLAKICQSAEHEFAGTMCGIMDPLVAALARDRHALLIDCRSLETRAVPIDSSRAAIVVCDTGVRHRLASSQYNERRADCHECERLLTGFAGTTGSLRDVPLAGLPDALARLPEPLRPRCRHVVTENARTREAADCLARGDLEGFGKRMYASHASLRDDYEVSCVELDLLVEVAAAAPGVYGARMTGGGFGGCTVTLVANAAAEELQERLARAFRARFGRPPRSFVSAACAGARELENKI